MKKIYIVLISILTLAILGTLVYFAFFANNKSQPANNSNNVVSLDPNNIPKDKNISIPNRSGGLTKVDNFLNDSSSKVEANRVGLIEEASGGITYSLQDSTFYITISAETKEDMDAEVQRMETELLRQLNITQTEACALSVNIRTMPSYNQDTSDKSFGLSFCNN